MKPIVLTQEAKDNALEIFKNLLNNAEGNTDLKINITTETLLIEQGIEKPTVFILSSAYNKMMALIKSSNKELAWYGVATRIKHNYFIEDILVYPQTVTAATVDADEEKCAKWFMELPDDIINNLKFQGHSHVGMTASPSGRDTNNWLQFANLLKPDEFMLLCIGNNKGDFYWNIYDKAINVFFENKDITMTIVDEKGNSIIDWAKESIEKYIEEQKPTYTTTPTGFRGGKIPSSSVKDFNNNYQIMFDEHTETSLNGHNYKVVSDAASSKKSKTEDTMLSYVPSEYKGEIEYESETDTYYTDVVGIPGFVYNHLYRCFICEGPAFRYAHPKAKVGRPKKDKKDK
jgi:hypothetical protein